ncbi:hypothetical protein BDV93DRAFT_551386 [Ceratobasidium sp. AG-I]|nr:hypothetical protein BDV93DRAFT_551386 [Ceratobasidium sp. AG-I]
MDMGTLVRVCRRIALPPAAGGPDWEHWMCRRCADGAAVGQWPTARAARR